MKGINGLRTFGSRVKTLLYRNEGVTNEPQPRKQKWYLMLYSQLSNTDMNHTQKTRMVSLAVQSTL